MIVWWSQHLATALLHCSTSHVFTARFMATALYDGCLSMALRNVLLGCSQLFYTCKTMVMIDARVVWGHAPPGKFFKSGFWDCFWSHILVLKSCTCSYLFQPSKPLETTEQSCQKRSPLLFNTERRCELPGRLNWPLVIYLYCHHLACIISHTYSSATILCAALALNVVWKINNPVVTESSSL